jgi:hypothetical protein
MKKMHTENLSGWSPKQSESMVEMVDTAQILVGFQSLDFSNTAVAIET